MGNEAFIDFDLVELIDSKIDVSVRLRHCINVAMEDDEFPIRTVFDYLEAGPEAHLMFSKIPNMGRKSLRELDDLVNGCKHDQTITNSFGKANSTKRARGKYVQFNGKSRKPSTIDLRDLALYGGASVRLLNCLSAALEDDYFPIRTVGDYVNAGSNAAEALLRLPSMGKKSLLELGSLVAEISSEEESEIIDERESLYSKCPESIRNLKISEAVQFDISFFGLSRSISRAEEFNTVPFNSIGEYFLAGENASKILKNTSRLSKKKITQVDTLIRNIFQYPNDYQIQISTTDRSPGLTGETEPDIKDIGDILLSNLKEKLSERDYIVLLERGTGNKTLEELGSQIGVTRERIRQVEKKAISNILRVYEEAFKIIVQKISNILEESYGEIGLDDASQSLGIDPDTLKLLVYIGSKLFKSKTRVKNNYISSEIADDEKSSWNDAIESSLYSLRWPIYLNQLFEANPDIPQSYTTRYLLKKKGAIFQDDKILELKKIPQTARITYVLRDAGRQLHSSEIARRYRKMFNLKMSEHNAQSTVNRMEEALIVDRGAYALYEQLDFSDQELDDIRRQSYNYLLKDRKFISSKVIYAELFRGNDEHKKINNAYVLHGILQDDPRFAIKRGFMVGIEGTSDFTEHKSLWDEIIDTVGKLGASSVSDIKNAISDTRKVFSANITKVLDDAPNIIKTSPGTYDTVENVFGDMHSFNNLKLAIKIALVDHEQGIFELTSNLRKIPLPKHFKVTKSLVISVFKKMEHVTEKGNMYCFETSNLAYKKYDQLIKDSIRKNMSREQISAIINRAVKGVMGKKLLEVDFRLQSPMPTKDAEGDLTDSNEIKSILSAFQI